MSFVYLFFFSNGVQSTDECMSYRDLITSEITLWLLHSGQCAILTTG